MTTRPSAEGGVLRHVGVAVPVRDEEELLPLCLAALARACERLVAARAHLRPQVVVVLDGCRDGSARAVADASWPTGLPRPVALALPPAGVGAARAAGARELLRLAGAGPAASAGRAGTWLASTDADSVVPPGWMLAQVEAAEAGTDAWVGTVELGLRHPPGSPRARLAARWASHQRHHEDHDHVHGANLGVRADAYLAVGGFPRVLTGEDVALVAALHAGGARLLRTAAHPVTTSDRQLGRAPDGVAADLAELALDLAEAPVTLRLEPDAHAS